MHWHHHFEWGGRGGCGGGRGGGRGRWDRAEDYEQDTELAMGALLDLLAEGPGSGYDLVQKLEERLRGAYQVGAGDVYPLLQLMEDLGHVAAEGGPPRAYRITEAGQAFRTKHRAALDVFWEGAEAGRFRSEVHATFRELKSLLWLFKSGIHQGGLDLKGLKGIREAIEVATAALKEHLEKQQKAA